ncbi:MAG: formate dehydrogenase accessory sulfurtransferase FdhD [Campylobacteraceae bacterium]|nr:formate dehydrogenase accessory sulfurtransferase FdhD [Campylobacteraceae bacterium]
MEAISKIEITKIKNYEKNLVIDTLVKEIVLTIYVNEQRVAIMMATPTDIKPLIIGYLISEDIVSKFSDIDEISLESKNEFEISVKVKSQNTNLASIEKLNTEGIIISGCGSSKTANIDPNLDKFIKSDVRFGSSLILSKMATFYTECDLYEQTGCVHTAKLFIDDDEFYIGEDIAQHNTIDKVLGKALMNGGNLESSFLMVSGRLSSEMVAKAVVHGVPVLVSRTAPTYLGVEIAIKYNLTLCGFARGSSMNVYSGEKRIR